MLCDEEFEIESYYDGLCPVCGQLYVYDEGHRIQLTEYQWKVLRQATQVSWFSKG